MARLKRSDGSRPSLQKEETKNSQLRFYGDEFVFNTASGLFYRISPTTAFLLRMLEDGAKTADLPGLLQSRYQLSAATASHDVARFLNDLTALQLLSPAQLQSARRPS